MKEGGGEGKCERERALERLRSAALDSSWVLRVYGDLEYHDDDFLLLRLEYFSSSVLFVCV